MPKLGLIAGNGKLPLLIAEEAAQQGWEVIAFAVEGDAEEREITPRVKGIYWLRPEQVGRLIELLHQEGIKDVVMAGKVQKKRIFHDMKPDARAIKMLLALANRSDDSLLGAVAREIESEGIKLHPITFCLNGVMAQRGTVTGGPLTPAQWGDIRFGWKIAKEIGRMDIGQTVVVKDKAVLAVEAVEGTDEAIRRGGRLGGVGATVVKVAKPQQDWRFDVPTIGRETILSMEEVKASLLAVEAEATIFLERDEVLSGAKRAGITMVAVKDPEREAPDK